MNASEYRTRSYQESRAAGLSIQRAARLADEDEAVYADEMRNAKSDLCTICEDTAQVRLEDDEEQEFVDDDGTYRRANGDIVHVACEVQEILEMDLN